jgi:drug/metabolite transporter (DMT)-like permease
MMNKKENVGTFLALLAAVISGFSIFVNKVFIISLDPLVFTAVRATLIGFIFLILSLNRSNWKFKSFKKVSWKYLFFIGIVGGGVAFFLFFSGLKVTTGGRAAFLQKTLPLYVTALAFLFLKEKISKKQIAALLFMIIGTFAIFSSEISPSDLWLNPMYGDLLVVAATVLWAVENVISRKAMILGESNFIVSFARMTFGAVFLFGLLLLSSNFYSLFSLSQIQWGYILISTAILFAYILTYYWSIKYINVSKASSILLISPVITLVLGVVFLNEPAPEIQIIGSLIILAGAYLISNIKSEFSKV